MPRATAQVDLKGGMPGAASQAGKDDHRWVSFARGSPNELPSGTGKADQRLPDVGRVRDGKRVQGQRHKLLVTR